MTRSIVFTPSTGPAGTELHYAERAAGDRALFVVLQDLASASPGSRRNFLRAAYRAIVARFQSSDRPETAPAFMRGVVGVLDDTARQVDTRVDDFRGLGICVLVREGTSLYLLTGRDAPARVRSGGMLLPAGPGTAGAVEMGIESARAQQDLFAQTLTDSLALYRFGTASAAEGAGVEFLLGGTPEDAAAVLDALEVRMGGDGGVRLERGAHTVVYVSCAAQGGAGEPLARVAAPAGAGTQRRLVRAAVPAAVVLAALVVWRVAGGGDGAPAPQRAGSAPQERPVLQDVEENLPATEVEVAAATPPSRDASEFSLSWRKDYRDAVTSSPVAAGDAVVFGARDGNVYALDLHSGETVWTHRAGGGVGASPVITGDGIIACDYAGNVFRLAVRDGRSVWKRELKEKIISTPAVTSERVITGTMRGNVYALSRESGRVLWKFRTRGQIRGAIAAARGSVFVPSHDGRLYALAEDTGAKRWSQALHGPVTASPAVAGDRVFIGTADGKVLAFDAATGKQRWSFAAGTAVNSSLLVADGRVYAGCGDQNLYCLDAGDGGLLWKHRTSGVILSRAAVDRGRVLITSYDGAIYCLDGASGALVDRFDTAKAIFSSPLVMDGRVYFGNNDGRFYGLDLPR
ncbi:MAG TPA: PQQ-binding-like beta-propeller repeat protein [Candidatus Krumholzibacteria bacterium]|nr:PQQ-binding-like beta-propeller repeat protein [Candidatus Krumholzibacteria bacterium]